MANRATDSVMTRPVGQLRLHRLAKDVPAMTREECAALRSDVAVRGVVVPIEINAAGVILDGRHRFEAARELGLRDVPVRVIAPADEYEYIWQAAVNRRHLNASQRAALVIELDSYRQRQEHARRRQRSALQKRSVVAPVPPPGGRSREYAARLGNCGARTVQDALFVRTHDRAKFEAVKAGQLPAKRARQQIQREQRDASLPLALPLPDGPFALIYADPPWQLGNPDSDYAPEQYYPTLPLEQIKQFPIPAADDALLYLWAVNSHLPQALEVLDAWGFEYVGNEVWVKDRIGMGVWTRYRHELLLIGRRGKASPPEPKRRLDSVIEASRKRHSQKPAVLYERLERLYPHLSKLELYARGKPRPGWTAWGNEVEAA